MNLRVSTLSPLIALALAACAVPDSPTVELGPDDATTTDPLSLRLAAPAEAPEDIDYAVVWSRDGEIVDAYADALEVPAEATAKGEMWTATVTPVNANGREGIAVSAEITILNTPPTVEVSIADEVPLTTTDLEISALASDADGDEVQLDVSWLRDGELTSITTDTVPASETSKGEIWTVVVVPADDEESGDAVQASVSIDNSLPVAESVSLSPDSPLVTDTIVATVIGSDEDGDALTWIYEWTVDGTTVDDVDGPELSPGAYAKGQVIAVRAVPNDGFVDGSATEAAVTAINSLPAIEAASIEPTVVREGDVASCVPSGWTDPDGDIARYQVAWEVDGAVVAETPTLNGDAFDRGSSVVCALTPDDGEGLGATVRSAIVVIQNTPPSLATASLSSTSPSTLDPITATAAGASDVDGDVVSLSFAWSVNGALVWTDATTSAESTLDAEWFGKGDTVSVSVTPEDDADSGVAVSSGVATVVNAAPGVGGVTLDLASPKTEDRLTATATRVVDPDGDTVSLEWAWSVNSTVVATETTSGTSASLDGATYFDSGDVVNVTVTPTDGTDSGTAVSALAVTVVNTLPTIDSVAVTPTSPKTGDDVSAALSNAEDLDGDTMTFTYVWSVNGSEVLTDTSASDRSALGASNYDKGDSITVSVTAADADGSSIAVVSSAVSVVNTAPVATAVGLDDTSPTTDASVVATVIADDVDGDTLSYDWSWAVDGTEVFTETTTATTSSLDGGTYFDKGQVIVATVTPRDGDGPGTAVNSPSATAVNSAPNLTSVTIGPDPLKEGATATPTVLGGDADGDALTYTYAWAVNGTASGAGSTLASSSFDKGDTVQVTVTADDGSETASLASSTLTVANSAPTAPGIDIDPTVPEETDELFCEVTTASTDADGDSVSYDIAWEKNGVAWTGSTLTTTHADDTIDTSEVSGGDDWTCTVSAFDGTDSSSEVTSTEVTVKAPIPTVGTTGTHGVISGNGWTVCRADSSTAWVAHGSGGGGTYNADSICSFLGYTGGVDAQGGTCGTSCGRCGTAGLESYDGGGGSTTSMSHTVHWRCAN